MGRMINTRICGVGVSCSRLPMWAPTSLPPPQQGGGKGRPLHGHQTYVARVGLNGGLRLLSGSKVSELEAARVFLKTRQTRYVDGQSSERW